MPSPFPGMNPYLEHPHGWADFHQTFIPAVRAALTPQVVPNYFVQVQEHIYLHEPEEGERALLGVADVNVAREPGAGPAGGGTATLAAPARVTLPRFVKERSAYLQVVERDGGRVVTVVELLSPSNKYAGPDRESYLAKRQELLTGPVSFVELDLLRGGPRMPLGGLPECDYYALVSRPADRPEADVWPVKLRDPLPRIPIPLAPGDREAVVDLQTILHQVYDAAGYHYQVYRRAPAPQFSSADAAWAAGLVPGGATGPG